MVGFKETGCWSLSELCVDVFVAGVMQLHGQQRLQYRVHALHAGVVFVEDDDVMVEFFQRSAKGKPGPIVGMPSCASDLNDPNRRGEDTNSTLQQEDRC